MLLANYIFGVSVAVADEVDDAKTWVGLLFAIGFLCSSLGNFYPNTYHKVIGGFAVVLFSSVLLFGSTPFQIVALVFSVGGYSLAYDALLVYLDDISRRKFEHWSELWSSQCLGIGFGAVWGTMSITKLHMVTALLPYQIAVVVVGYFSLKHFKDFRRHNRYNLES